jgi:hypothetical protein
VNSEDALETIDRYAKQGKFSFSMGKDNAGVVQAYGVKAFPANYVVGSDGKVAFRCIGFDERGIRSALSKLEIE